MAKAPVIEDVQIRHAFKVAAVTGQTPARDVALLHVLYGTGMTATELALLEVADVLTEQSALRRESEVRAAMSFNGRRRSVFWTNPRVCESLDAYFAERVTAGHGVTAWRSQWRGLVQLGPVFLTSDGRPFTLTTRKTSAGNVSRSCESLTQVIRKLHDQAGIEAAGASVARRTLGVRLHRRGYDLRHIREVLGLATLSATKALCDGDPLDLGRIVARVL
jgi:site-specific recombinase XerD